MRALPFCSALLFSVAAASAASADPLPLNSLPENTRWVIHIDVDAARNAKPLWDLARLRVFEPRRDQLAPMIAAFERLAGMNLPDDLHDVTLFGSTFDENNVCILIHGKINKDAVTAAIADDKDFRRQVYNIREIFQWREKSRDRLMFLSFVRPNLVVQSPNRLAVQNVVDASDAIAQTIKSDSPLAPPSPSPAQPAPFLWIAADNLADLPTGKVESPLFTQMNAASLALRFADNRLSAESRVQAKSDKAAQQLQAVANGIKAFVALSAQGGGGQHVPPPLRAAADALEPMSVQTDGKLVKTEWSIDMPTINKLLNMTPLLPPPPARPPASLPSP